MRLIRLAKLAALLIFGGSTTSWSMDHQRLYAKEVALPAFQQGVLAKDAPLTDLRFSSGTTLLMTGQTALWRWDLDTGKLTRLQLIDGTDKNLAPLKRVGTDGLSDFVASDNRLFQVNWSPRRVLQYELGDNGSTLDFAGNGDNYWLIQTHHLVRFDRYTKSVLNRYEFQLPMSSKTVFDTKKQRLWYLAKREIRYLDLNDSDHSSHLSAKLKSDGLDLQLTPNELLALSATGVLRLNLDGKSVQSIPVEGRRRLRNMAISGSYHAYLFDDQNLEIYDGQAKLASVTQLPANIPEDIAVLRITKGSVALLRAGAPRVFTLSTEKPGDE